MESKELLVESPIGVCGSDPMERFAGGRFPRGVATGDCGVLLVQS